MKQEIIEQLRSLLPANCNTCCRNEFENSDVPSLNESNEPFFWEVRQSGTDLAFIGPEAIGSFFDTEQGRIKMFAYPEYPISWVTYLWCGNPRLFYYDGARVSEVSIEEAKCIYHALWDGFLEAKKTEYPQEYEASQKHLDLEFLGDTKSFVREMVSLAREMRDTSLIRCLQSFKRWERHFLNHYIRISKDSWSDNSFYFSEQVNGKTGTCGGIIYSKNDYGYGHWSIHT